MTNPEFRENVLKTEAPLPASLQGFHTYEGRLLHAAIGLSTESGELLDALKKRIFYGKDLDLVNIKEELGDLLWYLLIALDAIDCSMVDCMKTNIAKLKERYPNKFTQSDALNRDLAAERKILERNE